MHQVPAIANTQSHMPIGVPTDHEMMVYTTMAKQAVESKMYRGIGDQAGVMMIMLAARELGIPAMQALNGGLNIIQGKVEISARMMNALIRKAGHQISVKESTDTSCTLIGTRRDNGESISATYTVADAQKAGLVKTGGGWVKCPKDMCFARALSRLARQLFSDVIGIGYVEGEIKPTDSVVAIPESIPEMVAEVEVETEEDYLKKYFELFQKEDHFMALEYLEHVMQHFTWTKIEAIKQFLKAPERVQEKFMFWKNKYKL